LVREESYFMKILHIAEYAKGGVYTYINELASRQQYIHDVYILASKRKSEPKFDIGTDKIFYYDYDRHPKYFLKTMLYYNKMINKIKPDIIHIHSTFAGLLCRLLFFIKNKKASIIYSPHGWSFTMDVSWFKKKIYALIEKLLTVKTDMIINISQSQQDEAIKFGINSKKMVVIYNGVPESSHSIQSLKFDNNKIHILFVGRWDKQKGIDILFRAIKEINDDNLEFHIVGEQVLSDVKLDIPPQVKSYGWLDKDEIDQYYQASDCVIVPSRWEGFGLVAIEAMRNKKAVIASNRGALPEIVENNVNGLIFDMDKAPQSLIEILRYIAGNKQKLKIMGEKGYEVYKEKFHIDMCHNQVLKLYEDVQRKRR